MLSLGKFLGFQPFWFGHNKILQFQVKKSTKMVSTFPVHVSVKMCTKLIPTKGKHIWNLYFSTFQKEKKENWDLVGVSCYADLNHWRTTPLCTFQGPTTWCANKISLKNQLHNHMKELKSPKPYKTSSREKLVGSCWRTEIMKVKGQFFSCLLCFRSSETVCANIRKLLKWQQLVETVYF